MTADFQDQKKHSRNASFMSRFVEIWDDKFAQNRATQPGIDVWFIHTPRLPTKGFPAVGLTTVLISQSEDAETRSVWEALRGAFVFATVQHRRFEGVDAIKSVEHCLGDLPQISQVVVHAPNGGHEESITQIGNLLRRMCASLSVLVTSKTGKFPLGLFDGCIRADANLLALTTLSTLLMVQGLDATVEYVCVDVEDVKFVMGNDASDVRLVEALWLPATQKLIFFDEREAQHVEGSCALWVSLEGTQSSLIQHSQILKSLPLGDTKRKSERNFIFNQPIRQYYTTALYGSATRVRILCR